MDRPPGFHLHLVVRTVGRARKGVELVALPYVLLVLVVILVVLERLVAGELVAVDPAIGLRVVDVPASLPVDISVDVAEHGSHRIPAVDLKLVAEVRVADDDVAAPGVLSVEREIALVLSLAAPDAVRRREVRNLRDAEEGRNVLKAHVSLPPVALRAHLCPISHVPDGRSESSARSGMYRTAS